MVEACVGVAQPDQLRECQASDVQNMNMDKQVATRLHKMLAVNDQTVAAVKRDHASYAKLSLLTQQMNLLQHQAQTVVDKCEAKAIKFPKSEHTSDTRLALSEEFDDGAQRLVGMLALSKTTADTISCDDGASARLSLLAEQVGLLQAQAKQAVDDAALNKLLTEIGMSSRIVPGTVYYHYKQNGKDVLSRIANDEWCNYDEYHGKYLYDYDFIFRRLHGDVVDTDWHAATVPLPQGMYMPQLSMSMKVDALGSAAPAQAAAPLNVDATPAQSQSCGSEHRAEASEVTPAKAVCPVLSRW